VLVVFSRGCTVLVTVVLCVVAGIVNAIDCTTVLDILLLFAVVVVAVCFGDTSTSVVTVCDTLDWTPSLVGGGDAVVLSP
jgi:hypothetical protein